MKRGLIHFACGEPSVNTRIMCGGFTSPKKNLSKDDFIFIDIMKIFFGEPRRIGLSGRFYPEMDGILYSFEVKNITCKRCLFLMDKGQEVDYENV